jgi:anion-transporting  ArsA/GET3 family ATPase
VTSEAQPSGHRRPDADGRDQDAGLDAPRGSISDLLEGKRVCVCAGSGGVGKTTTSAAIAMGMAARGLRVAVVTIDPAKRLATALGVEELGNEPHLVAPERFAEQGLEMRGELWAMMLDAKLTFDELIERLAPDAATRDQVLENRIYRELSGAVAGSQEFTAIAKLHELHSAGGFDLLVLDTPPSRNALDFLDAPDRLSDFFEGRALRFFLRPTGLGMRLIGRGTGLALSVLRRVTGVELLKDLSTFFSALGGMLDAFKLRAVQVGELLADPGTTFLLVTSPEREPIEEAIYFWRKLKSARMPFGGVIVNRMHHDALAGDEDLDSLATALTDELGPKLTGKVMDNLREYRLLAGRDAANVERLLARLEEKPLIAVPHLDEDVHDVAGLLAVQRYLFASAEERERMLAPVES